MSAADGAVPTTPAPAANRWPQVIWLTVVWVLLWGTISVKIVLGGLLVAVIVTLLFPMPSTGPRLPFRPLPLLSLIGFLTYDLAVSGVQVSWETLRYGPRARAGIIAVPMLAGSDRVITMTAGALSLAPGSYVLQIDRRRGVWYVYALGLRGTGDVARVRRMVLYLQRRVIVAFGTAEELTACDRGLVTS
ncbi:Na+/H+ antiporter subunit E [Pseudonocardia bannensis]|uniref:Na+/H+ antiporter subunit E n=1 Tax=Pseudonocardia bannensis TaxID=630973 RepID=A0A848DGU2_9PSEU|nr:Na+/H+ antiporter subunit E [Pseudonocardia bannensis]NMH91753.1 Na+/H+ antiporter subunit E [Pseudonocardia bannensis]